MEFYFTNREFDLIDIASTDGAGLIAMIDDHEIMQYENDDLIRFTGTLVFEQSEDKLNRVKNMTELGNYIIYRRYDGSDACLTIMDYSHNPTDGTRTISCEDAGLDLLNNIVPIVEMNTDQSFEYYWNIAMADTGILLGTNIYENSKLTLSYTSEENSLERLRKLIADFGGGKFTLNFEFNNTRLITKTMNIVEDIGNETDITLRVDKDVDSIVTDGNIYELVTAIRPFGSKPEGSNSPINLVGFEWTDPDGRFILNNGLITDTQEAPKWSRLLSTTNGLFTRAITYNTLDKSQLVSEAVNHLKEFSKPVFNYNVNVVDANIELSIGDRVNIVDEFDELYLSGKVLTTDRSSSEDSLSIVLGDFRIKYDGISDELRQIASDFSKQFDESIPAQVILTPSKQFFVDGAGTISINAAVLKGDRDISDLFTQYRWRRYDSSGALDPTFNQVGRTITVSAGSSSVYTYQCSVDY